MPKRASSPSDSRPVSMFDTTAITQQEEPPRKKICRLFAKMPSFTSKQITIVAGTGLISIFDQRTFYAHAEVLTAHSDFFAAALGKKWKEGEERVIRMPEDRADHIATFIGFAYYGTINIKLPMFTAIQSASEIVEGKKDAAEITFIRDCYLLADKLMSVNFKDALVDALIERVNEHGSNPIKLHETIYAKTSGPCGIRRLLVDIGVWRWSKPAMRTTEMGAAWMEFFRDVAVRYQDLDGWKKNVEPPYKKQGCFYHDHGDKPCYKTLFE